MNDHEWTEWSYGIEASYRMSMPRCQIDNTFTFMSDTKRFYFIFLTDLNSLIISHK